ncbi:unnamed protein product [Pseudo-nitzschia multistriata]|uniref:YCII-related domain-containing protein n=1 Tax=Pseudo-nitzschia multistriata TaxID=183589 RepID=A0A448ZRF6_9STRA|nr:unnamed protein product [Pseudo-nitzschia multistriata]
MKLVKLYTLRYAYRPDVLLKRVPYRDEHLKWVKQYLEEGKCLSVGTCNPPPSALSTKEDDGPTVPTGALFVFKDESSAQEYVRGDPYCAKAKDIVAAHTIEEWNTIEF